MIFLNDLGFGPAKWAGIAIHILMALLVALQGQRASIAGIEVL